MTRPHLLQAGFFGLVIALVCTDASAQNADELAKKLSNPVASLISVPLQFNYDDGYGADHNGDRFFLNIQPVIPVSLNKDWNMISRTILPVISQDDIFQGAGSQSGLGDVTQSLFFSPKALTRSGWTWGIGPALLLPTATDDLLGTEKWSVGPTAVAVKQTAGGWTYGALANHLWSVAGDNDRADISSTFFQPVLSKGLGKGRTVSVNFESSYDWKGEQWTVPLTPGWPSRTCSRGGHGGPMGGARASPAGPGARVRLSIVAMIARLWR